MNKTTRTNLPDAGIVAVGDENITLGVGDNSPHTAEMRIERRLSVNNRAENQRATSARDACDNAAGRYFADPLIRVIADQEIVPAVNGDEEGRVQLEAGGRSPIPQVKLEAKDLLKKVHAEDPQRWHKMVAAWRGVSEETTTGVHRLYKMQEQGKLLVPAINVRSEEHTSELQSLRHLVCRLLLEKKKRKTTYKRDPRRRRSSWLVLYHLY